MAEATIPVDLLNPGQVFACIGLMEVANALSGSTSPVTGAHAWRDRGTAACFTLSAPGHDDPVAAVVRFLAGAGVSSVGPAGHPALRTETPWSVATAEAESACFPFELPDSPATLPARLTGPAPDGRAVQVDIEHWGDARTTGAERDNVKFWAGSGGYPGAALARDAVSQLAGLDGEHLLAAARDPFSVEARMSSSFRFDWRRDYVPLDTGFSPNEHGKRYAMVGFPLVELLAAIGLQNARPQRIDKLSYRYAVAGEALPLSLARAALGGAPFMFRTRTFRMRLGWPGKEGQSRCIVDTQEETTA